ncbi:hypothetical protein Tsubulata_049986, partial [Turnera subulata]
NYGSYVENLNWWNHFPPFRVLIIGQLSFCRNIPERAHPFSQGIGRHLCNFCCALHSLYSLERVPTSMEIEEKLRPYTCLDFSLLCMINSLFPTKFHCELYVKTQVYVINVSSRIWHSS